MPQIIMKLITGAGVVFFTLILLCAIDMLHFHKPNNKDRTMWWFILCVCCFGIIALFTINYFI